MLVRPSADLVIIASAFAAAGIARFDRSHARDMFEHPLYPPETAAGKNRDLFALWFDDSALGGVITLPSAA